MNLQNIFISNLKKYRKMRGLSQEALAELCKTSGNYVAEIEGGRRLPSFEKIEDLSRALRISSDKLFVAPEENQDLEKNFSAKDYLSGLPAAAKKEISTYIINAVRDAVKNSLC